MPTVWTISKLFQTHYPARGRKLIPTDGIVLISLITCFKPITPQGDGNLTHSTEYAVVSQNLLFQTHYPARGRKLTFRITIEISVRMFQTHYPARGRKQLSLQVHHEPMQSSFKPITPQGDGNLSASLSATLRSEVVSNPLPRKGTETKFQAVSS